MSRPTAEEAARALVDFGYVPALWEDAEVEISAVSYVHIHPQPGPVAEGVLRGATVGECVARKDSAAKDSIDPSLVIDPLRERLLAFMSARCAIVSDAKMKHGAEAESDQPSELIDLHHRSIGNVARGRIDADQQAIA